MHWRWSPSPSPRRSYAKPFHGFWSIEPPPTNPSVNPSIARRRNSICSNRLRTSPLPIRRNWIGSRAPSRNRPAICLLRSSNLEGLLRGSWLWCLGSWIPCSKGKWLRNCRSSRSLLLEKWATEVCMGLTGRIALWCSYTSFARLVSGPICKSIWALRLLERLLVQGSSPCQIRRWTSEILIRSSLIWGMVLLIFCPFGRLMC